MKYILLLSCFVLGSCYTIQNAKHHTPNVIILIADDMGIGDVGCFGNDTIKTPNIDKIAKQGVKFSHSLAGENLCTPSRAALLTGRYAIRSGLASGPNDQRVILHTSATGGLPSNETTFGRLYYEKGYRTAYFGKWHLGVHKHGVDFNHHPLNHGFSYYYGMPLTNLDDCGGDGDLTEVRYLLKIFGSVQAIRVCFVVAFVSSFALLVIPLNRKLKLLLIILSLIVAIIAGGNLAVVKVHQHTLCVLMRNTEIIEQPVYLPTLTQRLTKEVTKYIKENKDRPFLTMVQYHKVHTALFVDKEFEGKSNHGLYGDVVQELDWSVGQILNLLEDTGLRENTFVYFSSDHGPLLDHYVDGVAQGGWNGPFKGGKGTSWEGGIRVPTVAMWPAVIPSNTVVDDPVSQLDLFPTLMKILHLPPADDRVIDGQDFLPVVTKSHEEIHERFIFHYCGKSLQAVTYIPYPKDHIWKLHYNIPAWKDGKERCEGVCLCYPPHVIKLRPPLLFDLRSDPTEDKPFSSMQDSYRTISMKIAKAVTKHKKTVVPVEDQLTVSKNIPNLNTLMCCNFPLCTCKEADTEKAEL